MHSDKKTVIFLLAVALAFVAGISHLFILRYRRGDVYPPYSSLRADPLGTKAFCESLGRLDGLNVTRNRKDIRTLELDQNTVLLSLGDRIHRGEYIDSSIAGALNSFVRKGGRVVFAFLPSNLKLTEDKEEEKKEEPKETKQDEAKKPGGAAEKAKDPPPT